MDLQKLKGWLEVSLEGAVQEGKDLRKYGRSLGPEKKGFLRGRAHAYKQAIGFVDRLIAELEEE